VVFHLFIFRVDLLIASIYLLLYTITVIHLQVLCFSTLFLLSTFHILLFKPISSLACRLFFILPISIESGEPISSQHCPSKDFMNMSPFPINFPSLFSNYQSTSVHLDFISVCFQAEQV